MFKFIILISKEKLDFLEAVRTGDLEKLKTCIEKNKDIINCQDEKDNTALMLAIQHNRIEIINYFLDHVEFIKLTINLANKSNSTALIEAIKTSDEKTVEKLIEIGANINGPINGPANRSPLINAIGIDIQF